MSAEPNSQSAGAEIQGTLTEADYVVAQRLHAKRRPIFAVLGLLLLLTALAVIYVDRSWSVAAALVVLFLLFFVYEPFKAKRFFRQHKALSERMSVEIRDDGLYFRRQNGAALVPWSYVIKWRSNDQLLLLYPSRNMFYLLPSHFFQTRDAFNEFIHRVEAKLGKAT